ncbi:hypothetical protein LWM68_14155 [Niabella sp. W65]|nr:hypothetical protein [Niabella sp. W65]MCH7363790.1 hypothetical protein [Niabella sp. W65]
MAGNSPSVSPENSFFLNGKHVNVCMGPTIDNQITRNFSIMLSKQQKF